MTETWHESSSSPSLIASVPNGFSFVDIARPSANPLSTRHSSYGGICLIFKSCFSISVDPSFKFSSCECLFTCLKSNFSKFNIVVIYRPPSSSKSQFLDDFHNLSESLYSQSIPFYIFGDFNISLNKPNDFYVSKFLQILSTFNLSQHCNFPTQKRGNTIDLIISSSFTTISNINSEQVHFSDHYFISCSLSLSHPFSRFSSVIIKRSWNNFDHEKFSNLFLASGFSSSTFDDVDDFMNAFVLTTSSILDILAPLKSFRYRLSSKKAPWFDHECILSKRSVRKLERAFRSSLSISSWNAWKDYLISHRTLLFNKHSSYLRQSIISFSNSKNRWSFLSKLLHKNSPPPFFSPDEYLNFITDKIFNIHSSSKSNTTPSFTKFSPDPECLSSFTPITLSHLTKLTLLFRTLFLILLLIK